MRTERSPGMKLFFAGIVAVVLIVPLLAIYALVYDREQQSSEAQNAITAGWGGAQIVTGPVLVVPYLAESVESETVDGQRRERRIRTRRELFISPTQQAVDTTIAPDRRQFAIYESVVYETQMSGTASFALPDELERMDIEPGDLLLDQAELRFGVSDPRGLAGGSQVTVDGAEVALQPGNGPASTSGAGFSAFIDWTGEAPLAVRWQYGLRGSHSLALLPRGGDTRWEVTSPWPHPSFGASFLPDERTVSEEGFTATYAGITNLALGRPLAATIDDGPPMISGGDYMRSVDVAMPMGPGEQSMAASIGLVDPVDLYAQVNRAVKYGFLFIGFTFATFLMFDIVGGARVAAAEYLLTGAGLVLFFVMLLALAEVVGFAIAYLLAAAAIIGLLTAYSAAVLGTWRRAGFIGLLLVGLYALLYVLLNMETYSLLIGAVLLFAALAGIMYATRKIDWSAVNRPQDEVLD